MTSPWLSVVMPVHNGSGFLGATLDSVVQERPDGVEFLVLDSGDDQGASRAIVERHADHLAIRYFAMPDCKPWTAKTNRGVAMASARHVAMLHQDDLWLDGHLAAARGAIAANPAAALSVGPSRFIDAAGRDVGPWRLPFTAGDHPGADFIATLIVQNTVAIPSPVIRRAAWLASGGMNESLWYTADWDLYLKLAQHGPVHVRSSATTAFRLHRSSLTMAGSADIAAFRSQLVSVFEVHLVNLAEAERTRRSRIGRTSIAINCALAEAAQGKPSALLRALIQLARLGPREAVNLLHDSRLTDRIISRLHLLKQRQAAA